jgi:hypothetical protein
MRSTSIRIESDRDALPFPSGGVRGPNTSDIASEMDAQIEQVQLRINDLERQLNDSAEADFRATRSIIGRIHAAQGSFPPAAA